MVPAFRFIVKRQRQINWSPSFGSGTDFSSFKAFMAPRSSSVPFPFPGAFDARRDASLVACIGHGLGSEVDEIVLQDEVAKEVNLVFDGPGTGTFVERTGLGSMSTR